MPNNNPITFGYPFAEQWGKMNSSKKEEIAQLLKTSTIKLEETIIKKSLK